MRRIAVAVMVALMAIGILAGASTNVNAAGLNQSCWGDWCSGKYAVVTGCADDARVVDEEMVYSAGQVSVGYGPVGFGVADGAIGEVELWWSDVCQTNWAQLSIWDSYFGPLTVWAIQETGYVQYYTVQFAGGGAIHSPMIYSPVLRVRAAVNGVVLDASTGWV